MDRTAIIARCASRRRASAFVEFVPGLIDGLAHAEEPDDAVTAFDRFLQALQRGGRLISLLSQNRDLVALVALILGAAPRLGDMLARQPQIMDGLIDPRFFGAMPDQTRIVGAAGGDACRMRTPTRSFSIGCGCSARRACS